MLFQFQNYLTLENIYFWSNFLVLPFWFLLIIVPNSRVNKIFVNSIIIPLALASAYAYSIYQAFLSSDSFVDVFNLYLSLESLYTLFATESFLVIFWLHFIAINLFLGSWVSSEGIKYDIPRSIIFVPLLLVYFSGPVGLVLFWIIRIFYAKKIRLHD